MKKNKSEKKNHWNQIIDFFLFWQIQYIARFMPIIYGAIIHGIKKWTDFILFVYKCVYVSVSALWWSAHKFSISINGMYSVFRASKQSKKSEFMAQNNQRKMLPIHLLILRHLVDFKSCILYYFYFIQFVICAYMGVVIELYYFYYWLYIITKHILTFLSKF